MQKGKFITLEGSEGSGKTTSIALIKHVLQGHNIDVIVTREPGGTAVSEKIRDVLLDKNNKSICSDAELLLMFAARSQHLNELIIPALATGKWVICDRFTDASFAYQGYARGIELQRIEQLQQWAQGELRPYKTLLFDLPVEIGMARANKRGPSDRFEQEQLDFFEKVRQGYLSLAKNEPQRFVLIDATQSLIEVGEKVTEIIEQLIS